MKYFYSITVSGMINEDKDARDTREDIQDIQEVLLNSFPHDLQPGVTVQNMNMNVNAILHENDSPVNQIGQNALKERY